MDRSTAERALQAVREQFAAYLDDDCDPGPQLYADWAWNGDPAPYAIVWEGGPFEWPQLVPDGGVDQDLTALAQDVAPGAVVHAPEATGWPPGTWAEPITGFALAVLDL